MNDLAVCCRSPTALLANIAAVKAEPARFRRDPEHTSITIFVHHLGARRAPVQRRLPERAGIP